MIFENAINLQLLTGPTSYLNSLVSLDMTSSSLTIDSLVCESAYMLKFFYANIRPSRYTKT